MRLTSMTQCGLKTILSNTSMSWIQQLTSNGNLRVCINTGNALLAQLDPIRQQPTGISVTLARAFAEEHGLQLQMTVLGTAKAAVEAVASNAADIGFFAIDPDRAKDIHFTRAYLGIDACYIVRTDSTINYLQDVDSAENRIVVGADSAYDLFLSRHIQLATLVRAASTPEVMTLFEAGTYEVAAGLQQAMNKEVEENPHLRLLLPPFMTIAQAMGCHPNHSQEVKQGLEAFVSEQLRQNFIADQIEQQGLIGIRQANV
jgi:polar amino acid transport system substrate-binding protein